jgi:hypothetical protein
MAKQRKSRRSRQKGGFWPFDQTNPSQYGQYGQNPQSNSWFSSGDTNSYGQGQYPQKKSWFDSLFSNSNQPSYGQSSSSYPSSSYSSSSYPSSSYPSSYPRIPTGQSYSNQSNGTSGMGLPFGGKGRNKTSKMTGGKMTELSGAPVDGLNVAKPTYYLKNGGKRGKTQRRKKH